MQAKLTFQQIYIGFILLQYNWSYSEENFHTKKHKPRPLADQGCCERLMLKPCSKVNYIITI